MKMVLDDAAGLNMVSTYESGSVKIRGQHYKNSLLIFPREIQEWPIKSFSELNAKALRAVPQNRPELLILGTGDRQQFPDPRIFIPLMDANIGYEIMDNAAACRTFNILLGEGRQAALALLLEN